MATEGFRSAARGRLRPGTFAATNACSKGSSVGIIQMAKTIIPSSKKDKPRQPPNRFQFPDLQTGSLSENKQG
jgi:hypothetical protein